MTVFADLSAALQIGLRLYLNQTEIEWYANNFMRTRQVYIRLKEVYNAPGSQTTARNLERFPNLHCGMHLLDVRRRVGTFTNVATSLGEELHKTHKTAAPATSHVSTHLQLMRRANTMRTLRYLVQDMDTQDEPDAQADERNPSRRVIRELLPRLAAQDCPDLIAALQPTRQRGDGAHEVTFSLRGKLTNTQILANPLRLDLGRADTRDSRQLLQAYNLMGDNRRVLAGTQLTYYKSVVLTCQQIERQTISVGNHIWYDQGAAVLTVATVELVVEHREEIFLKLRPWQRVGTDIGVPIVALPREVRECFTVVREGR